MIAFRRIPDQPIPCDVWVAASTADDGRSNFHFQREATALVLHRIVGGIERRKPYLERGAFVAGVVLRHIAGMAYNQLLALIGSSEYARLDDTGKRKAAQKAIAAARN